MSDIGVVEDPTEIRCKEQSKGGLKFDVIIADPAIPPPKRPGSPNNKTTSAENIEGKLKAAEERRLSLEANKMATLAAQLSKIEEASKKKDEQNSVFINQTKEALEQKMETHIEKREQYISEIKTKLKDHLEGVEKSRQLLEQQTQDVRTAVEEKLKSAAAHRDENIKKILDRLKEHEDQVKKIRSNWQEKINSLEAQLQSKMDSAIIRKQQIEAEQREKLRTLNNLKFMKINELKLTLEDMEKQSEKVKEIQEKIEYAGSKREQEIAKKLEPIKKNEKRAEMVRQNKERLSQCEPEIVSSA
ncbi:unnamed protein product [Nezara viridula]|uniref:Stathmin n=1 Tax=Nezara viridula TaxID=85310 RepID=A0A9P0H758_NEZVI|nr:unnamed protein product [Nezara viridula]